MKKYILSLAVIIFVTLLWLLPFPSAQPESGIVQDQGLVEQPQGKVKQPIDEFNAAKAKEKASKDEAEHLGRETARRFYNGQITSDEVQSRYQRMLSQGLQRDYMRGYNAWKSQNVPAQKEETKEEDTTEEE